MLSAVLDFPKGMNHSSISVTIKIKYRGTRKLFFSFLGFGFGSQLDRK